MKYFNCGEQLITAATLIAFKLARGKNTEELGTLAALFTVIGDELALLAIEKDKLCDSQTDK
ncbi:MAG: hypothetical protein K5917_04150 [Clostridiales bacterium]|nr:hypothetical protein [Clostridiales bacterium]